MKVFWVIVIILIFLGLGWVGLSFFNSCSGQNTNQLNIPAQEKASHTVYIENTGNLLLTNDYEVHGTEPGSRVFIIRGFWELRGQEFKFIDEDVYLNEAIFGEITIKRR